MYLGMLLVLLGWGLFLGNALGLGLAMLFIPLMNRLQIGPEERILTNLFGRQFTTYQSTVRRWL
jgi:protein-S-isoprenylcysteine O-methyltransferase Ste14